MVVGVIEQLVLSDQCLVRLLLTILSLLLSVSAVYIVLWRRRCPPCPPSLTRIRGRVSAVSSSAERSATFRLQTTPDCSTEVLLDGHTSFLSGQGALRPGNWVTVDCIQVPRPVEVLYREPARADHLLALHIIKGVWPEIRWLRPAAVGLLLLIGLLLLDASAVHEPRTLRAPEGVEAVLIDSRRNGPRAFFPVMCVPPRKPGWLTRPHSEDACVLQYSECTRDRCPAENSGDCEDTFTACQQAVFNRR